MGEKELFLSKRRKKKKPNQTKTNVNYILQTKMASTTATATTAYLSPLSVPLIGGKLEARAAKLVKKAQGGKAAKRGVPEVTKLVRKGKEGVVLLAGDVYPVELLAHLPGLCEEQKVLYCFMRSRRDLADALGSKRPVSAVFVPAPGADAPHEGAYAPFVEALKAVHPYMGAGEMPSPGQAVGTGGEEAPATVEKEKKTKKRDAAEATEEPAATGATAEEPAKKKKK